MSHFFGSGGGSGGSGDVVGPASSTDNALVRFDGTTGKLVQNSVGILSDAGALSGLASVQTTYINFDNDTTPGATSNGDLFRTSDGLFYNYGGNEINLTVPNGWSSVGTGGQFATVSAAITALGSGGKVALVSDVTEGGSISFPAEWALHLNNFTLDMEANQSSLATGGVLTILGLGQNSVFAYATSSQAEAVVTDATAKVVISNFTYSNTSTVQDTRITTGLEELDGSSIHLSCPNVSTTNATPLGLEINNDLSSARNIYVTGAGSSTDCCVAMFADGTIENISFQGTFANTVLAPQLRVSEGKVDGLYNSSQIAVEIGGSLVNVEASNILNIYADAPHSVFANIRGVTTGTTVNFDGQNNDFLTITNFHFNKLTDSATSTNWKVSDGWIDDATTVAGDYHQWNNVEVDNTFTVSAGADFNQFNGMLWQGNVSITSDTSRYQGICDTGVTFTLNSTASYNKVDVTIDQVVVDSSGNGTNVISQIPY